MIKKGDFVRVSYTAKLEDGTVIDSTDESVAKEHGVYEEGARYGSIVVVVGEGHVLRGLDEDLEGKEAGYKGSVEVPPEKAFGEYNPDNKEVISITKFKERPVPGQRVQVGEKVGTVEKVIGRRAIVDFNHPLAGKKIIFEYEIEEIIEKPEEKIKYLFLIYTGRELEPKIEDGKVIVEVPKDASFNQYFLLGKYTVVDQIFKHIEGVKEVVFMEVFEKPEEEKDKQGSAETEEKSEAEGEEKEE
ncbi:FKBP-type peptidyl-prolyl cis-trans isomerase [Geoglobus acetivorans]|uniref:Peptidyl-prolyl cis-trans isomerase n=1 Tax=Geoglobus acetivorans TaxID=565033 RepID=A0ABZ3H485_GEOAI|nr:FKBP-type peptidyl-prolyl cis-trans isomerase [Geoglobus acetivorans]